MPKVDSYVATRNKEYQKAYRQRVKKWKTSNVQKYTKARKVINLSKRIYERKKRVGGDPKRIVNRMSNIAFKLTQTDARCAIAGDFWNETNLDDWAESLQNHDPDLLPDAADSVALLKEWIYYCRNYTLRFPTWYTEDITMTLNGEDVTFPFFFSNDTESLALDSYYHLPRLGVILFYEGKLYWRRAQKCKLPKNLPYEVVNTYVRNERKEKWLADMLEKDTFFKLLKKWTLTAEETARLCKESI